MTLAPWVNVTLNVTRTALTQHRVTTKGDAREEMKPQGINHDFSELGVTHADSQTGRGFSEPSTRAALKSPEFSNARQEFEEDDLKRDWIPLHPASQTNVYCI